MIRSLYATLVRLHPRAFRRHFGDEMLSIFDQTADRDRPALVGDAVFSLLRQWLLRPDFREPERSAQERAAGAPVFYVLDDEPRLTREQWVWGAALSLLSFMAASFLISHGGNPAERTVGSGGSSTGGVRVESRAPMAKADTEVATAEDVQLNGNARRLVGAYFDRIRVLRALDRNHDLVISPYEIANAPAALRSLDTNGDGKLDTKETGVLDGLAMVYFDPAMVALDTDHDGVISSSEIANSAVALRSLDANHDGRLTAGELLPTDLVKELHEGNAP